MQVSSPVSVHHVFNNPCSGNGFEDDFSLKLRVNDELPAAAASVNDEEPPQLEVEEGEEEDEEFSFACLNPDGSPISADDIFVNGQIRPVFPLFNRDLLFDAAEAKNSSESLRPPLRKLFVESDHDSTVSSSEADEPEGPYCAWTGKAAVEASPEVCKKSNSTGFSKLRRFRELVLRSNSDGKDAFVFLNNNNQNQSNNPPTASSTKTSQTQKNKNASKAEKEKQKAVLKKKGKKSETTSSAHEKLYIKNRAMKEESKRKSYLPYRVGFFTNVNGLSRNIHPY